MSLYITYYAFFGHSTIKKHCIRNFKNLNHICDTQYNGFVKTVYWLPTGLAKIKYLCCGTFSGKFVYKSS